MTDNLRYFCFSLNWDQFSALFVILYAHEESREMASLTEKCLFAQNWGQVFRKWKSDHFKDTESDLGPSAGFQGWNYPEASGIFSFPCFNATRLAMLSALLFLSFSFLARRFPFFRLNRGLCCVRVLSVAVGVRGFLCWVTKCREVTNNNNNKIRFR